MSLPAQTMQPGRMVLDIVRLLPNMVLCAVVMKVLS
jgi:hypothetical protein